MKKKETVKLISAFASCFVVVLLTLVIVFFPNSRDGEELLPPHLSETQSDENTQEKTAEPTSETDGENLPELYEETVISEYTVENPGNEENSESIESQPEEFVRLLGKGGVDINTIDCSQLVIVESSGNSAEVYFFEKQDSGLWQDTGMTAYGWVGRNGVDDKSQEGDGKTPFGLYSVGDAFYIGDMPSTGLDSFQITENTYWVDDPQSVYYNQRVEGTENKDWNSAEHMISYTQSYKYGFVVNFNMDPIVPGKGSAIFFHCGTAPTAGCVAVPESNMLSYLEKLDKNKNPYILLL